MFDEENQRTEESWRKNESVDPIESFPPKQPQLKLFYSGFLITHGAPPSSSLGKI